jgi:hypothetical protein
MRGAEVRAAVVPRVRAVPAWAWVALIVVGSAVFRYVLSRRIVAPWIMVDELIYSELAKSFAASGRFLVRGQADFGVGIVYPALISPAWRAFGAIPDAYAAAKAINSLLMSLAAVPAFLLARRVVARPLALLAALLAVAVPSMVYTGTLMTENAFYPLFLLVVFLLVLVLERPTAPLQVALLALAGIAFLTRAQAVVLLPAIALAPPLHLWFRREPWHALARWRVTYGLLALGVAGGLVLQQARGRSLLGAYQAATHGDYTVATSFRWLVYHVGELSLYVGVIPLAAFALLVWLGRGLPRPLQAFLAAALPVSVLLVVEVAVFASVQVERIEERNLFYVAPLLLIALLAWIELGLPRPRAASVVALAAAALVGAVPYAGLINGNSAADTLAFLPLWTLQDTVITLDQVAAVAVLGAIALGVAFLTCPRRFALALPAVVLVWFACTLAAIETNAHGGAHALSLQALFGGTTKLTTPDWIDRQVGRGADVAFLWSGDENRKSSLWTNEFFNRSIGPVFDLGPAAPGGLPSRPARIDERTGMLVGAGRADFVLTDESVHLAGERVGGDPGRQLVLYRVTGPLRVAWSTTGIDPDTWSGPDATYTRYASDGGSLRVLLARDETLFPQPQLVHANGLSFVVAGRQRWITVPLAIEDGRCTAAFDVAPTRVPGPDDPRRLGIHFARFDYVR